jgi:hypothetical protein
MQIFEWLEWLIRSDVDKLRLRLKMNPYSIKKNVKITTEKKAHYNKKSKNELIF